MVTNLVQCKVCMGFNSGIRPGYRDGLVFVGRSDVFDLSTSKVILW